MGQRNPAPLDGWKPVNNMGCLPPFSTGAGFRNHSRYFFGGRIGGRNIGDLINIGDLRFYNQQNMQNLSCKLNWVSQPRSEQTFGCVTKSFLFMVSVAVPALIGRFPLDWIPCRNQAAQIPHGKMYFCGFFITQFGFERILSFDPKDWDIFVSSSLFYRHIMTWQISHLFWTCLLYSSFSWVDF
jgi:hypothetical protein